MESGSSKIYTRTGDKGKTSLVGGQRVSKAHRRLDAYGTVDELNSFIGLLMHDMRVEILEPSEVGNLMTTLSELQCDLFDLGSQLATEDEATRVKLPMISETRISFLEKEMDRYSTTLKPLRNFVLPGGCRSAAMAHVARTVCRRAERLCVALVESGEGHVDALLIRYLNRLSDFLFVFARYLNHLLSIDEPIWIAKKG
jgi:cob(I)alamin adenosyltransferase